ncbi:hypothetical protein FSP39_001299 [Pinctada imbricata]|uniref:DNA 3'-5' helicase n=1 Tax=Pinctada imbricata TaxID=66713 RepID=A0AA89C4N7_PINIB|nr:hypothetical protein FSP39_001299 [Pinctada imbricata]
MRNFDEICQKYNIAELSKNQEDTIQAVCEKRDVYVGTRTGSGKSLIYESMPVVLPGCAVVIIAPLVAIMKEQTERLNKFGFKATYIGRDGCEEEDILNGRFDFIFGSPEAVVGEKKWTNILSDYGQRLKLIVVDEAHTVVQWGMESKTDEAFREMFSHVGELRSVRPDIPFLALTATSAPTKRRKIMKSLCFKANAKVICESPDRSNIKISALCIPNNDNLEETFHWLINDLKEHQSHFPRHVVFCERISTVANIYSVFRKNFGDSSMYEMFHSKTPEDVKEKIRNDMSTAGNIRVLICTNSAGMGVNFHGLHNIVHYCIPREMDTLVQQMGRAGRDGSFSHELILYKDHKGHMKLVDRELLLMVKDSKCRRNVLCTAYVTEKTSVTPSHNCCDLCEKKCQCGRSDCPGTHRAFQDVTIDSDDDTALQRTVTDEDLEILNDVFQKDWIYSDANDSSSDTDSDYDIP